MLDEAALQPADKRIGFAAPHGQRPNAVALVRTIVRAVSGVTPLRPTEVMDVGDVVAITRTVLRIDHIEISASAQCQPEAFDALLDH